MQTLATWDQSRFNEALRLAMERTSRTPALAVNTAAYFVSRAWIREMPKASIEKIDTELGTATNLTRIKSGKRFRKAKKDQTFKGGRMGRDHTTVPLAALIINARAKPGSRYNEITKNRYARASSPFKGVSREAGAALMRMAINRMIKTRHSSSAFLKSSIIPVIKELERFVSPKYRRGAPLMDNTAKQRGVDKGGAEAANDEWNTFATIQSDIGAVGVLAERMNTALWQHGAPALQRAFDQEADRQLKYVADKELQEMAKAFNAMAL